MVQGFTVAVALAAAVLSLSARCSALPQGKELERLIAQSPRPSVLISEAELIALRQAISVPGLRREAYLSPLKPGQSQYSGVAIKAVADKWLAAKTTIPAQGGHGHNFFCDCGTRLILPPDMEPSASYKCPACGKVFSGEKYDAAVRMFKHHALADAAVYLALVYAIEGKKKYADKAAEILRKYAEAYPGPHTNITTGGILFQSLNEAMWAIPLAQAYDLIYGSGSLTDADKRLVEDRLFRPVAQGLINSRGGGNWESWHLSAIGVIGFAIHDPSLVDYSLKEFQGQMAHDLGDDGLWPESVHCYHFFPLQAFVYLAEAAERSGIDLYGYEPKPGKGLEAMFTAPLQYMYPSFRLPAVNDGWYESWLPLNLYEAAYRRWPDSTSLAWVLKNGYEREKDAHLESSLSYLGGPALYRFLFGDKLPDSPPSPDFRSTDFSNFGLCTLRNDDVMLTFHYGRFLGHGHLDKLSFTLCANTREHPELIEGRSGGTALVPDYGTPGYGSRILPWYQSTAGHNTVVVDGKNQERSRESAIDIFHAGDVAQYAEAHTTDCYPGVTQQRRILLLGSLCLIIDDLTSDHPHDFDWLLHCEGKPEPVGSYAAGEIAKGAYPHVVFDQIDSFSDSYRVDYTTAKTRLALAIWTGPGGGIAGTGKCPAETDARHTSFLACRKHGTSARFMCALALSHPRERVGEARNGDVMTIRLGDETYYISTKPTAGADLATDAELAAVRIKGGKVVGAVLVRGSRLIWRGRSLLEKASAVDYAETALQ